MGAFVAPHLVDIRGKMIFLRGSFALCPGVFLTLVYTCQLLALRPYSLSPRVHTAGG